MDKYEYRAKTEQMLAYAEQKSYQKAMSIADTIDWRKVKNTAMLSTVSEIYENAGELGKARDTLFIAYDKAPSSRKVVYRLGIISLKLGHFDEAADCYEEFVKLAPKDPNQYILRYKILKAQKAPVKEQIEALEDFKHSEYVEKWAYELARLYAEAGMTSECLDECDDLILWFSEGTYVYQAMELKMKYKPLTPLQQEKYDHRNDGIGRKDSSKRKPSFRKSKERPEPNPRIADKVRKDVHVTDSIDLPDLPEPMARTHASEPEAESQPKTRIRSTSDISTTISGASLSDALKAGVAVASGAVAPESASDDSQMTGKMKIEEILANWEATQRENAKILEKSQEEAEKEKALREKKKEEEEEVLGATKPILSDDIRKLMEQLENGEEPEITDEDAEDFVDDEEDEATESPEDSSKEASDTDEEEPEENDFEEIVDSEEDDESDAVYDEEAEYEDEDESEYDDETRMKMIPSMTTTRNTKMKMIPSMTTTRNTRMKMIPSMTTTRNTRMKMIPSMMTTRNTKMRMIPSMTTTRNTKMKMIPSMTTTRNTKMKTIPSMTTTRNTKMKMIPSMTMTRNTKMKMIPSMTMTRNTRMKTIPSMTMRKNTRMKTKMTTRSMMN